MIRFEGKSNRRTRRDRRDLISCINSVFEISGQKSPPSSLFKGRRASLRASLEDSALAPFVKGSCEKIEIFPLTPLSRKGGGEKYSNSKRISLPLDGGGTGWGWQMDFFTPSEDEGGFVGLSKS
jgi:hypothetical protein